MPARAPAVAHLIGVPLDLGGGRRGVDMGPSAVRIAGLGERLPAMGCTVVDKGDLATPIAETRDARDPTKKYIREIARVCQTALSAGLRSRIAEGALPIVLGGDHSLAAGSVGASADFAAAQGSEHRAHLGRRARRHEHAGDDDQRATCTGCRSRRSSVPSRPSSRAIGGASPKVRADQHGAHRHSQSRRPGEGADSRLAACTSSR